MPIIKLKNRPNYEGTLFGVPFHDSISDWSVNSTDLRKFEVSGYAYEIFEEEKRFKTKLENAKAKNDDFIVQIDNLKKDLKNEKYKYDQLKKDYVNLFDMYNHLKDTVEKQQVEIDKHMRLVNRYESIKV